MFQSQEIIALFQIVMNVPAIHVKTLENVSINLLIIAASVKMVTQGGIAKMVGKFDCLHKDIKILVIPMSE